MSNTDSKVTEIQKLLHLLQAEGSIDYQFLEKLDKEEIQKLRLKFMDVSQFTQTDIWKRLTGVSRFLPNYMNAKVAETVLGAMITANMSYYMPVRDAVSIMKHLSTPYLVNVTEFLIPEKSKILISQIPIDILKKVTIELINNKKYIVTAGFVDVLELSTVIELSKIIYKEEDIIRVSMYVENKNYVAKIVEGFTNQKLEKIIKTAYDHHLQEEVLTVFSHMNNKEVMRTLNIISTLNVNEKTKILSDFEQRIIKKNE
jgi:hypothetical protein